MMRSPTPALSTPPAYTVLIVESLSTQRDLYRRTLLADATCRYTLLETDSATAALLICQQHEIDSILLNDTLPDATGLDFVQALQQQQEPPPVVMVASEGDPAIAVRAIKQGAEDYLVKHTLTPQQLQVAVRSAIENTHLRLQLQHQEEQLKQRIVDLQQQQYRLQRLIDTAPIGIGIGTDSGEVRVINDEMLRLHGYTREQFEQEGMNWRDFTPPELSEQTDRALEQLRQEGVIPPKEKELIRRDGSRLPIWLSVMQWMDGSDEHVAFAVDLSQQKQAEAAVQLLNRELSDRITELQTLIDIAPVGIAIATDPSCAQMRHNAYLQELLGASPGQNISASSPAEAQANFQVFQNGQKLAAEDLPMQLAARLGVDVRDTILDIVLPDGRVRHLLSYASPIHGDLDEITGAIGAFLNITERKQAEAEREQLLAQAQTARAEAEAANRSKDEFVSIVAHELRSPLNAIMGWAQLLQSRSCDAATTQQALETIVRNAQAQEQLIEDLLDVTRMVRGTLQLEFASVNLGNVVAEAIETVRLTAEAKALQLDTQIQIIAPIRGDSRRLQQMVLNLLTNAIKFTPSLGQIRVLLDQHDAQVRIQISDTGKGISSDLLPHIFERFRQDKQNATTKQGLGLGLAIVRYIVEQHGGTIAVQSEGEGQGATFTVMLPLLQWDENLQIELPIPVLTDTTSEALSSIRVLLVDDNLDMLNLTTLILEQSGAVVQTANSATVALERLTQFQPDILISDIAMPEHDGYELLQKVRMIQPEGQIPAIALTARVSYSNREDIQRAGFAYHVVKPVEPNELIRAILNVLQLQG